MPNNIEKPVKPMKTEGHPADRMITVLDWWLKDHFDNGRNPRIESRINELKSEILDQTRGWDKLTKATYEDGVYYRTDCPFHYCDAPLECRPADKCRHNPEGK